MSSWLIGIARNRIADLQRTRGRRREWRGRSALAQLPDESRVPEIWDSERRRAILARAFRELRAQTKTDPRTIRAFERTVLAEVPPETVAEETAMTVEEVYVAKGGT